MRALACFVFIILAYTIQGVPSPHIVGGKDAPIGKFPYQVSLKLNGKHICGGSIINNLNVLTAADCVAQLENPMNNLKAHVGTNFLNVSGDVYDVANVIVHENYDSSTGANDIAIIHFKSSITYNILVQPISLMTSNEDLEGKQCTLSGWGSARVAEDPLNNLQEIELVVSPLEVCYGIWPVDDTNICISTQNKKGACKYDSGGPLVAFNGNQIGIFSHGPYICANESPDVYTKVSSFIAWIFANLKN